MYEQEITQYRSRPSSQKLKTMVKRHIDQRMKRGIFRLEMKELRREYWLRLKNGRTSALKGNQENHDSGMEKDSVQKEMPAASATTTVSVERKHNRSLLLQAADTK